MPWWPGFVIIFKIYTWVIRKISGLGLNAPYGSFAERISRFFTGLIQGVILPLYFELNPLKLGFYDLWAWLRGQQFKYAERGDVGYLICLDGSDQVSDLLIIAAMLPREPNTWERGWVYTDEIRHGILFVCWQRIDALVMYTYDASIKYKWEKERREWEMQKAQIFEDMSQ